MEEQEQDPLSHSICVYHAVSNAYDRKVPKVLAGDADEIDYEVRLANVNSRDSSLWNRYHKIASPPPHHYTVYMDGNIGPAPTLSIPRLVNASLNNVDESRHSDLAICKHAARKCAYVEIEACVGRKKITSREADLAHDKLKEIGLPKNFGLWECGILIRRRAIDPAVKKFYTLWWNLTSQVVCRDQIWLPAVLYMMRKQLPTNFLNTLEFDVRKNDYFTFKAHG